MADLNELNSAGMTKVIGSDSTGQETTPVGSTTNGELKTAISGTLDDAGTIAAVEDSTAPVRITPQRAVHTNLRNQAGTEVGTAAAPVRVDPTGTTTQPVSVASLPLPAGAATEAKQDTQITSLQLIDDVPHAQNAALSKGIPAMGQLDDAATTAATEDAVAVARITPQRAIHTNLRNQAGTEIGTTANPIVSKAQLQDNAGTGLTSTLVGAKQALDVNVTGGASDKTGSGTITALNGAVQANTQGCSIVTFKITGTWVATLIFEVSTDGSNWDTALETFDPSTGAQLSTSTSNRTVAVVCAGYQLARVRASLFTSGTATVAYDASAGAFAAYIANAMGNNSAAIPAQSVLVGGSDGTNLLPLATDSAGRLITSAITGFNSNFSFGDITTAALTLAAIRRTTYTEQTTNGQRSIASASASDAAAGTGARQVIITYLDQTGAGPYTETVTLNGTTGVNTVATNIAFIEKIQVSSVGSGGVNAGIITLYTAINKGGSVIGTIAATDLQTFWGHHYVPISKTCNITGFSNSHSGTTVGSGGLFILKAKTLNSATAPELQVSDFNRLYGQDSANPRNYGSPIKVVGPARIIIYVTPETSTSTVYRGAIDYFEP